MMATNPENDKKTPQILINPKRSETKIQDRIVTQIGVDAEMIPAFEAVVSRRPQ
jgi:5,10-methylenetetrahydrofolate reductase